MHSILFVVVSLAFAGYGCTWQLTRETSQASIYEEGLGQFLGSATKTSGDLLCKNTEIYHVKSPKPLIVIASFLLAFDPAVGWQSFVQAYYRTGTPVRSGGRSSLVRYISQFRKRAATPSGGSTQVITDIDDTVKSSGGVAIPLGGATIQLGGVDTSFKRNSFYPGVFQFNLELACHATKVGDTPEKVAVLTARAEEFRFALEIKPTSKLCAGFRKAAEARSVGDWGVGPVLYGSVQEWIIQERKGWRKFQNFKRLNARNEKRGGKQYIFLGDNGYSEKDLEAAQRIIKAFPGLMRAVFLHAVSNEEQPAPLPPDDEFEGVPILYFRTYSTAAVKAAKRGLLSVDGVRRVLDAVEADIEADDLNIPPGSDNELLYVTELNEARAWLAVRNLVPGVAALEAWWNDRRDGWLNDGIR
mmetsp:Transcript_165523/g.317701  ORF Transcript_165523/g.317701 Transcript_165523/m.317701 type:complete len:415 (+) Transcript_165523:37-1281(+)